jgi:hypothetical protein
MKGIKSRVALMAFVFSAFVSSAFAGDYYGYSFWLGHNKNMYISPVYSFSLSGSDYPERYFTERNNAFSRLLENNNYESATHNYSRRDSKTYESGSEARDEWEKTINSWKRMGYSVTRVDYQWSGPR